MGAASTVLGGSAGSPVARSAGRAFCALVRRAAETGHKIVGARPRGAPQEACAQGGRAAPQKMQNVESRTKFAKNKYVYANMRILLADFLWLVYIN